MLLTVKGISKQFKKKNKNIEALKPTTIEIAKGQILGVFGENGAGKTTLLKLLCGRLLPTEGELHWHTQKDQNDVFYMTEDDFRYSNMMVGYTLSVVRSCYPDYNIELENELMKKFDISKWHQYQRLSKGKKGLISCICGLASGAPITIFDEVFVSLDITTRRWFYEFILNECMESKRTFILTSHFANELSNLVENILILKEGNQVIFDTIDVVNEKAFELIGPTNELETILKDKKVLKWDSIGSQSKVYIYDVIEPSLNKQFIEMDIKKSHMDLDSLISVVKAVL